MKTYTLLLVEDEEGLRKVYTDYLTENGFDVIEAKDGEEAVEKAIKYADDIDIVLLDLMLPKLDGLGVLKMLRNNNKTRNLLIYITTVLASDETIKETKVLGADGYMIKDNLTPEDIKNRIIELIKSNENQGVK